MSRFVIPKDSGLAGGSTDDFKARLTKYIPAEVVSIYTIAIGGIVSAKPDVSNAKWIAIALIVVCFVAVVIYVAQRAPAGVVRKAHFIASPIAFLALAYPIASPLLGPWFIGFVAVLFQAVAALIAWIMAPELPPQAAATPAAAGNP